MGARGALGALTAALRCVFLAITLGAAACSDHAPSDDAATPPPSATVSAARIVERADSGRAEVALTFDTGDGAGDVAAVLVLLREAGARATFAVTGLWAEEQTPLLLAIAGDGHQIIYRGYHGVSFTGASTGDAALTGDERALQLSRTGTTAFRLSGRSTQPCVRTPYGDVDDSVRTDVARAGYDTIVLWSIDAGDDAGASSDAIAKRVVGAAWNGDVVRFDAGGRSAGIDAMATIIAGLRSSGLQMVTVEELLRE